MRYDFVYSISTWKLNGWFRVDWIDIQPPELWKKIWIMLKNGYIPYKWSKSEDY